MKPKKTIYCREAAKSKIWFETEQKANDYLKLNSEEILDEKGKSPIRSYYCKFCLGWHVTSNPKKELCERRANEKFEKCIAAKKALKNPAAVLLFAPRKVSEEEYNNACLFLEENISIVEQFIDINNISKFNDLIEIIEMELPSLSGYCTDRANNILKKVKKISKRHNNYIEAKTAFQEATNNCQSINQYRLPVRKIVFDYEFYLVSQLIEKKDYDKANNCIKGIEQQINVLTSIKEKKDLINSLDDLNKQLIQSQKKQKQNVKYYSYESNTIVKERNTNKAKQQESNIIERLQKIIYLINEENYNKAYDLLEINQMEIESLKDNGCDTSEFEKFQSKYMSIVSDYV